MTVVGDQPTTPDAPNMNEYDCPVTVIFSVRTLAPDVSTATAQVTALPLTDVQGYSVTSTVVGVPVLASGQ